MATFDTDVGVVKVGTPLQDADQDQEGFAEALLAVVEDMPARLTSGEGNADAVAAFADGLRSIADELDPPDDDDS